MVTNVFRLQIFESTGWQLEEPAANDDTKYDLIIPTIVKPANFSDFTGTLEVRTKRQSEKYDCGN